MSGIREKVVALVAELADTLSDPTQAWDIAVADFEYGVKQLLAPFPPHECGLCDGAIYYDGDRDGYATWICRACGWWHISRDCCQIKVATS